jgi:hypothetical protein
MGAPARTIGEMRTLLVAVAALLGSFQGDEPINVKCPVKPNQKSRPNITVVYEGQVIGFC